MKRLTGSIALAFVAILLLIAPVSAGRQWCARDPVIALNGIAVQILVAVPEEYAPAVNGPIDVRVWLPDSVEHEVIFLDAGFNGHGEVVRFQPTGAPVAADGSFDIRVRVSVPLDTPALAGADLVGGAVPLQLTIVTNGGLTWENSLPQVQGGETLVVEGISNGTSAVLTVTGSN
jgi:hypothetical protein